MLPSSIPSLAKKEEALSPKVAKELARLLKVKAMVPPRPDGWRQSSAASRGVSLVRRLQARGLTPISSLKINKQQSVTSSRRRSPSRCRLSLTDTEMPKPQQPSLLSKKTHETDLEAIKILTDGPLIKESLSQSSSTSPISASTTRTRCPSTPAATRCCDPSGTTCTATPPSTRSSPSRRGPCTRSTARLSRHARLTHQKCPRLVACNASGVVECDGRRARLTSLALAAA